MNWFTISILPRRSHSFLNLNISMTWPVRTRRSPEQSRHKIIPKRVEFLWSARNKTRVPQNIRKSIRSNSPTAQLISALGDTCIYRFFFLFFLFFLFFFLVSFLAIPRSGFEGSRDKNKPIPPWPDSTVGPTCGATVSGLKCREFVGRKPLRWNKARHSFETAPSEKVGWWGIAKTGDGLRNTEDYIRACNRNKRIDDSRFSIPMYHFCPEIL